MDRLHVSYWVVFLSLAGQVSCSSEIDDQDSPSLGGNTGNAGSSSGGRSGGSGGSTTPSGGMQSSSGASGAAGKASGGSSNVGGSTSSGGSPSTPTTVACAKGITSALPELPELSGVTARVSGNRARVRVGAFSGARDYRIYALPDDSDVVAGDNLVVRNATYRCAGQTVAQRVAPALEIEWPAVESGKPLVVEALDAGCPFTGHLANRPAPEGVFSQPFLTPDQARDDDTGELFINGQFQPTNRPRPIARSIICLEPGPVPTMDFFEDFTNFDETLRTVRREDHNYVDLYMQSESFDISFLRIEPDAWGFGAVDQQLWVAYSDWSADVGAKFRATIRHPVQISDTTFIHATMAVDAISTPRRYPQLWLSSAPVPVQDNIEDGVTINLEPFGGVPDELLLLQICDHQWWDVNEQCPIYYDPNSENDPAQIEFEEHTAVTLPVRFDLYLSTRRAYVFYDGLPYICADIPQGAFSPGEEITMTIGDVLYHSGADESIWDEPGPDIYQFHSEYQPTETRRVFDDVGLSEGVPAPSWDERRIPCFSRAYAE